MAPCIDMEVMTLSEKGNSTDTRIYYSEISDCGWSPLGLRLSESKKAVTEAYPWIYEGSIQTKSQHDPIRERTAFA